VFFSLTTDQQDVEQSRTSALPSIQEKQPSLHKHPLQRLLKHTHFLSAKQNRKKKHKKEPKQQDTGKTKRAKLKYRHVSR
jgi:hypothetical protein